MTDSRDMKVWLWRGLFVAVLVVGWLFIAWQNHFHISAPLVFVCFGYLAVVATVANLWRTGAAAVTGDEQENDSTWAKPAGALGELEREKRTLLKAIKEAEFDHQMGKLSQLDVDDMIRTYRARAIEVIKEIDRLETGLTGTPREQIMREVRARIELEARSQKKQDPKAAAAPVPGDAKPEAAAVEAASAEPPDAAGDAKLAASPEAAADVKAEAAGEAKAEAAGEAKAEAAGEAKAAQVEVVEAPADAASAKPAATKASAKSAKAEAKSSKKKDAAKVDAKTAASLEDEGMDADSTTSVEPKRNDPAKEATP